MNPKRKIFFGFSILMLLGFGSLLLVSGCSGDESGTETAAQAGETQLWTCGMHPEVVLEEPGNCPKCGMKLVPLKQTGAGEEHQHGSEAEPAKAGGKTQGERKILYWQAPMNPSEIYDHPGKSRMGMDLVPVYEDEGSTSGGGTVRIDPVTIQNMGVRYAPVERTDFSRDIRTVGKIDYNEETLYTVSPKISGWIEKLYVNYTGKLVKKNQPLLEIYSPELVTTQEEYLLALKNKEAVSQSSFASIQESAETLLLSTRKRLLYWDIPESEIQRLEKTGEIRKSVLLTAPANGVVVHKNAIEGTFVKEGTSLYQIADLSTVWVNASVYDYELPWISEGQEAEIELSYLPGKVIKGRVEYIYPYLNEKARDVQVRFKFPNPDLELKPGMYVNVRLQGKIMHDALVVPSEAVLRSGERSLVFLVRDGGKFEPREIRIGEEGGKDNRHLRVLDGLLEGDNVVTSAQFLLDSESRLQEAIQKMLKERAEKGKKTAVKKDEKMDMQMGGEMKNMKSDESHDHSKMNMDSGKETMNMPAGGHQH